MLATYISYNSFSICGNLTDTFNFGQELKFKTENNNSVCGRGEKYENI